MSSQPLSNHTPLAGLPVAVLDLETTGLRVRQDRIVEIGAVTMLGARLADAPKLDQLVDPGIPMPAAASAIHGIHDSDLRGKPSISDIAPALRELVADRVVVGHQIGFDLAVLRHEAARTGFEWREPAALDLALLVGALEPALPDLGLEAVARYLGVDVERRHRAMGDCLTAARCYVRLLVRLRELDVRTLGEARSLAARRTDLALRQAEAGWSAIPGEAAGFPPAPPFSRIDAFVFERRVADVMSAPPIFVAARTPVRAAALRMVEARIGAVLVDDGTGRAAGIVTERDLLRLAADRSADLDAVAVEAVMSKPVRSVQSGEMLYRALGLMDHWGARHLCVVDAAGIALGMVSQRDLLHHRTRSAHSLGAGIEAARDGAELAAEYGRTAGVAALLESEGLGGVEVARVISSELRAVAARAVAIAAGRLEAAGRGKAPAQWCLVVLGSGGRGESLLGADQDNALIHAGNDADDRWFADLGALTADLLDEAGVPRCKGGVMASSAEWRGSREQWRARVLSWLGRARPQDLLNVDIFFDLTPVAGEFALARDLLDEAVRAASRAPAFIGLLAQSVMSLPPILGFLGRPQSEAGRIDLKRNGLLPLVGMARTLALRCGSSARATPERLREAAAAGRLSEADAEALVVVHGDLLLRVLRQQSIDLAGGVRPSGRIEAARLDRKDAARLRDGLRRIDDVLLELGAAVAG